MRIENQSPFLAPFSVWLLNGSHVIILLSSKLYSKFCIFSYLFTSTLCHYGWQTPPYGYAVGAAGWALWAHVKGSGEFRGFSLKIYSTWSYQFYWHLDWVLNLNCLFQKWPHTDISPVESLLVVFAYEKCTGEKVTPEQQHLTAMT